MKFKKLAAGIMSAVMLATSAFAVNAGASGGITGYTEENFLNIYGKDLVQNGETVNVIDIKNGEYVDYSGRRYIHVEKTGKVEFEISGLSQTVGIGLMKEETMGWFIGLDTITVDGKSYKHDDIKKLESESDEYGGYYKLTTQSGVSISYGSFWRDQYTLSSADGKEHKIKLTYNKIEDGYYGVYVSSNYYDSTGKIIEPSKNTTLKFTFPSSSTASSSSSASTLAKTTLKTSTKNGKTTLKWTAVDGAEKYQLYVSTDGGKTYSRYKTYKATATKATYTLTKGNTYKFKVRSYKTVNGKKVYSKWSNVKTVKY